MSADDELIAALAKVEIFSSLPAKSLKLVANAVRAERIAAGATILEEDASGSIGRMYVVFEGTARAEIGGKSVGEFGPGDHFGEMSLLDGGPRAATVVAATDLRVGSLASFNFRALLQEEPAIAISVIAELSRRLRDARRAQG